MRPDILHRDNSLYTFSHENGGAARWAIKLFENLGPSTANSGWYQRQTQHNFEGLKPSMTPRIKDYFRCLQDQFTRQRHSRDGVMVAIELLEARYTTVLFIVEDSFAIYVMMKDKSTKEGERRQEWVWLPKGFHTTDKELRFLHIDMSADCTSVISVGQYHAYCWKFKQPPICKLANNLFSIGTRVGG